jgi:hypothetical protein
MRFSQLDLVIPKANEKVAFGATPYLLIHPRIHCLIRRISRRIQVFKDHSWRPAILQHGNVKGMREIIRERERGCGLRRI